MPSPRTSTAQVVLPHGQHLTPAEIGVSELVATGASNPDIGRALGISRHTVESHLKHIFTKLGVTNRVELALWFVRNVG